MEPLSVLPAAVGGVIGWAEKYSEQRSGTAVLGRKMGLIHEPGRGIKDCYQGLNEVAKSHVLLCGKLLNLKSVA